MSSYIVEMSFAIIALVAVIALAWLVIKAIKKVHTYQHKSNPLKTDLILPLGSRERIMVVSYKDTEYVLGVTPDSINLLDKKPITSDSDDEQHFKEAVTEASNKSSSTHN